MNLDYELLIPEYILAASALVVIAMGLFLPRARRLLPYLTALCAIAAAGASLVYADDPAKDFGGLVRVDEYTTFFRVLFAGVVAFVAIASARFADMRLRSRGEYYGLLLLSAIGATYMAAGRELITSYIGLELLSFCLYVLASYMRSDPRSNEGGVKYMLLGAFSSAIFLYGLSILYGITGTTTYDGIAESLASGGAEDFDFALLFALVLIIAGLGFKVSAVPFHTWAPDAYEGAPLPITSYIAATSKAAGFALLLRLFAEALAPAIDDWQWMLAIIATITMFVGNLIAIQQHNIKRLMAYSSIGQVGYMLIALVALSPDSGSAMLLHLAGYVITSLAAFTCIIAVYDHTGKEEIRDFAGLAENSPFLALCLTISLFSLAGMPLFAGFLTKFVLFQAATNEGFLWLAAIGVFNSFVSLYYYLIVIRQMYLGVPEQTGSFRVPAPMYGAVAVLTLGVLAIGLYPKPWFEMADEASEDIFSSPAQRQARAEP
jgi:NADH-quinone oxidoreductase subunit N